MYWASGFTLILMLVFHRKTYFFCKYACFLTKHIIACIIGYYLIHFLDSRLIVSVLEDNVTTK